VRTQRGDDRGDVDVLVRVHAEDDLLVVPCLVVVVGIGHAGHRSFVS